MAKRDGPTTDAVEAPSAPARVREANEWPHTDALEHPGSGIAEPPRAHDEGEAARGSVRDLAKLDLDVHLDASETQARGLLGESAGSSAPSASRPSMTGPGHYSDGRIDAHIEDDGTLRFDDPSPLGARGLGFDFDLTEATMTMLGQDTTSFEKARLAKATRASREALADATCSENLKAAVLEVRARLERIWRDARRSYPDRRMALFAVWEDCREDGPPELLAATSMVRQTVLAFIAEHLPAESRFAYTRDELSAVNLSRRTQAPFEPYAPLTAR